MSDNHPINPPLSLINQWWNEAKQNAKYDEPIGPLVATQAAQWGADQQLAKDAEWLNHNALNEPHLRITPVGQSLKEAMRPKPPSLKEQALELVNRSKSAMSVLTISEVETIRRALEALPE
jgi:hypothetical protein